MACQQAVVVMTSEADKVVVKREPPPPKLCDSAPAEVITFTSVIGREQEYPDALESMGSPAPAPVTSNSLGANISEGACDPIFEFINSARWTPRLTRWVLAIHTAIVGCTPIPGESAVSQRRAVTRAVAGRMLLATQFLDAMSWGIGKIFQYEAVILAEELGWCYITTSLLLTTSEISIEFLASLATPPLFGIVMRCNELSSKAIAHFALKAYTASNFVALFVYPIFGVLIHGFGIKSPWIVYSLATVRTLQYSFGNEVGDQSLQMSKPHWLATFRGVNVVIPGCACSAKSFPSFAREPNPDSLSTYIVLCKLGAMGVVTVLYTGIRKNGRLRWSLACVLLIWNALSSYLLHSGWITLSMGYIENSDAKMVLGERPPHDLFKLKGLEYSWLFFVTMALGIMPQVEDAFVSTLVHEMPQMIQGGLVMVFSVVMTVVLLHKISSTKSASDGKSRDSLDDGSANGIETRPEERKPETSSPSATSACTLQAGGTGLSAHFDNVRRSFRLRWLAPLFTMAAFMGIAASLLVLSSGAKLFAMIACALLVPVPPLKKMLEVHSDAFLMLYNPERVTRIAFWKGVFQVLANVPLLAVNWLTIELSTCGDDSAESASSDARSEEILVAGIITYTTVGLLVLTGLFFFFVDPFLPRGMSLSIAVEEVTLAGNGKGT